MGGEGIRIVAGRADHCEDTACRRLNSNNRPSFAFHKVVSQRLQLRINGSLNYCAFARAPLNKGFSAVNPQAVAQAAQLLVPACFDPVPRPLVDRDESGYRRIHITLRVSALILECVVYLRGCCQDRAPVVGKYRPAVNGKLVVQRAHIPRVSVEGAGPDDHNNGT